ncbi:hypothetical protein AX17_004421 [Amanita inopinata Kibby_2008]|nr:hypothetical protein AX17_004421 [Amanita inopinata Kibby_2008]
MSNVQSNDTSASVHFSAIASGISGLFPGLEPVTESDIREEWGLHVGRRTTPPATHPVSPAGTLPSSPVPPTRPPTPSPPEYAHSIPARAPRLKTCLRPQVLVKDGVAYLAIPIPQGGDIIDGIDVPSTMRGASRWTWNRPCPLPFPYPGPDSVPVLPTFFRQSVSMETTLPLSGPYVLELGVDLRAAGGAFRFSVQGDVAIEAPPGGAGDYEGDWEGAGRLGGGDREHGWEANAWDYTPGGGRGESDNSTSNPGVEGPTDPPA